MSHRYGSRRTPARPQPRKAPSKAVVAPPRPLPLTGRWLSVTLAFMFIVTALTQARLHLWQREDTLNKAEATGRYTVASIEHARRGQVLSADGKSLAIDQDVYELSVDFRRVPQVDAFYVALADAAGIAATDLANAASRGRRSLLWRDPLEAVRAQRIEHVKRVWRADGISLRRTQRRAYPLGAAASLIVGGWGPSGPLTGLEVSQDTLLRGVDGYQEGLVDRTGAFLPIRMTPKTRAAVDGATIKLTIDAPLQQVAFESIRGAVLRHDADIGCAIVLDPQTGDVRAVAQWPAFDPATPGTQGQFDMCVSGSYEPGSTFKVLTVAKALDAGLIRPTDTVSCRGELSLNKSWRIHCPERNGVRAHGVVDAERAIAKSCNVAASTWALEIGRPAMTRLFDELGLMSPAGVGLPSERSGRYNRDEYAQRLQLMHFGFGQSLSSTPLALASAFGTLANDGLLMRPRLIQRVGAQAWAPQPARQVFRPETAQEVMRLMEAVIESDIGTGAKLRVPGYRLAGKSGTAQKVGSGGGYVSSFVGFVPAENPRATILVMVDNPKGRRYYGTEVAGPVFTDLSRAVIRHFRLPAEAAL